MAVRSSFYRLSSAYWLLTLKYPDEGYSWSQDMDNWTNLNMTNLMIQDTDKTLIPIYQSFPPPRVANISNTEMCWREVKMDDERKNPVFCWLYHWDDNCLSFHCRRNTHTLQSSLAPDDDDGTFLGRSTSAVRLDKEGAWVERLVPATLWQQQQILRLARFCSLITQR